MKCVQNAMLTLEGLWEKAMSALNIRMTPTDVAEIVIIAFLLYYMLVWIKNTRAWMLLRLQQYSR